MSMEMLFNRYNETKQYKDRWLALFQDLYTYVLPDRDALNVKFNYIDTGKPTTNQIWDSTALIASYQRANDLHGLLLPEGRDWARFDFDKHKFEQGFIDNNQNVIDEINSNIMFYLKASNMNRCVSASNLDLNGGTGVLWMESHSDDVPLYFRSVPAVCTYIEYTTDDVAETGWYQAKMSGLSIMRSFPDYKSRLYNAIREAPYDNFTVIYGQIRMSEGRYYIYAVMQDDPFYPLFEKEMSYLQMIFYRDRVRPGEAEGRGIALDLLPAIRDLNRLVMYDRQSQAYKAFPPMMVNTDSFINMNSIKQWAGAWIPRNPNEQKNPVEFLQMPEHNSTMERILDLRDQINKAFMVEPLGEITDSVKSATEVSIRENRAQRTASTDISRLVNELPRQIYENSAKMLAERRLLTKNGRVMGINTKKLAFSFETPLNDSQKKDDVANLVQANQILQQFFGEETLLAAADIPSQIEMLRKNFNLKQALYKSKPDLMQTLTAMAKQQAQEQQASQQPQASTSAIPVAQPQSTSVQI